MPAYDVDLSFARAQSLIGGATGGVPYQTATSATTFVTIGTNGFVLTSNGTSPQWSPASATTVGTSTQVQTVLRTTAATHYLTFVDGNNASATAESLYTTSSMTINPGTGAVAFAGSLTQSGGYAYLGNHNADPASAARPIFGGSSMALSWNFSGGSAELNLWNTVSPAVYASTGFRFLQQLTASTQRDLVFFRQDGAVGFGGVANVGTAGQILQSNGAASPTWVPVSGTTVGTSTQVQTVLRTTNATHYLTFVPDNNAVAAAESVYTTSSFTINAMTGNVGIAANPSSTATYRLNVSNIIQVGAQGGSDVTLIGGGAGTGSFLKGYFGTDGTQAFNIVGNGDSYVNASTTKGNFGIGTNAPGYLLDVIKSTNDAIIRTRTSAAGAYFFADSAGTNGFAGTVLLNNGTERWFAGSYGYTSYAITQSRTSSTTAFAIDTNNSVVIASRLSVGTTSTTNKFEVAGSSGQLFSVSDSFTGTIFAASDISGIPSIEVLDTGLVKLAQYNGAVTIGTGTVAASTATLSVYGMLYTAGTLGEIRASSEITAYFSSDRRLKENIKLIEDPITMIDQISGVYFDWTDEHIARRGGEDGYFVRKHDIGVIAQEIEAIMPEVVAQREDGFLAVKYEKIVPLLIEAIKAQNKKISNLESEIQTIKNLINK